MSLQSCACPSEARYSHVLPYHNVTAWYSTFSGSVRHGYIEPEKGTRMIVGTLASMCFKMLMYGGGAERPASPWRFADRHELPPPRCPAERRPQLLRISLKRHRLAQDSDTPRNTVDQAV